MLLNEVHELWPRLPSRRTFDLGMIGRFRDGIKRWDLVKNAAVVLFLEAFFKDFAGGV